MSAPSTPRFAARDAVMIFNPRAARARRWRDRVRAWLASRGVHRWWETESAGHAAALAETATAEGADLLIVGGGDGTVHEVAAGLLRGAAAVPLLPVPLGTGNDFVRSLGLPLAVPEALDTLEVGRVRALDAGRVNGQETFVNSAGFGFDAEVARRRRGGGLVRSYTPTVVRTFFGYAPTTFELVADGATFRGRALSISILNGRFVGGGYCVAPNADATDGRFDVCLFEPLGMLRFARYVGRVRRGTHGDLPIFHTWRASRVTLRGERLAAHLDGEYRAFRDATSLTLEVLPGVLKVLA